jgi:hypothetical protein
MPIGGGKYDDACTKAQKMTNAHSVILMVIGGNKGNGFSLQSFDMMFPVRVPELLRELAQKIDNELKLIDNELKLKARNEENG